MSVAKMELVNIIGHMNALDAVILACGKTGVSQPDDALTFFSDTSDFLPVHEDNPYIDPVNRLEGAASRIGVELKAVQAEVTADTDKDALLRYVEEFSGRVADLARQRGQLAMRSESLAKDCEQFEHFIGLDIDLESILDCKMIKVRFGRLPKESYEKLKLYEDNPYVIFFPGVCDEEYYWGVYFAPIDSAPEVDRTFSSLYFERLRVPSAQGTPQTIVEHLKAEKTENDKQLQELDHQIENVWLEERDRCQQKYSQLRQLCYLFSIRRYAARYNDKFVLTGWFAAKDEKKMRLALDAVDDIEYTIERDKDDKHHTPPVKLRNLSLFKPFEFYVNMYGMPRYGEIDPTAMVAITYTILFGIMFGDLGQGICVSIIGWLMWKYKKMGIGKILVPCGISSAVFGVLFGSVFGFEHLLDPLYKAAFGLPGKPIEVMEPMTTKIILISSAGIGLVLIIISMLLNIVSSLRRHDFVSGLMGASGLAGMVFYSALLFGLIAKLVGWSVMNTPYILLLIVLPLICMFMQEPFGKLLEGDPHWKPEKWGEYCVQSFFELFESLLSYMSNTMSYLRVGAFVLVHAGMMMAVFTLANMFGTVGYIVTVILGNGLVMAMEALLVAIQVLRLEYYEMFSRYYIGDGRPFKPVTVLSDEKVYTERV